MSKSSSFARRSLAAASVALLGVTGLAIAPASAQAGSGIVINEILYNPADDVDDHEFLELHNPTGAPISLNGATIEDAIEVTFGAVTVPAGGYVVVSPSSAATSALYGVTPVATYSGKLSNGGETITLLAANGSTIDTVTYSDDAPWPTTADGDGPSLELTDANANNDSPAFWAASTAPTPGVVNSMAGAAPLPLVDNVAATPLRPAPGQQVTVTADVPAATAVLTYKVGFAAPISVAMTVTNGSATATVPGQAAGQLVRYSIESGGAAAPTADDTIDYLGYVVNDPATIDNLPVIQWFMAPAEYQDMIENHRFDDQMFKTTIAYDGIVYDGVDVRVRGGIYARTNFPKQSFEFEFPDGHDFIAPDLAPYPIDQFAMGSVWPDWSLGREHAAWTIFNEATGKPVHYATTQMQQNGEFFGIYRFSEKMDGEWRDAVGLDGGQFFKAADGGWTVTDGWEVKRPDDADLTNLNSAAAILRDDPPSAAKTAFLYENFDIPNVINYMAVSALLDHYDQVHHNFFVFEDTDDSGLFSVHPWDLDLTFGLNTPCTASNSADLSCVTDPLFISVNAVPEFEEMYWQRLRTLVDSELQASDLEDQHAALVNSVGNQLADLEVAEWGRVPMYNIAGTITEDFAERRALFANEPRLPAAQPSQPGIVITEILPSPNDDEAEVLELYNPTGSAVDLSGWTVDGADATIPSGTVILPGGYVVLTDSIAKLRASLDGQNIIIVEFDGGLKGGGETLTLQNAEGSIVDEVTYATSSPWPSPPDGFSLELEPNAANNNVAVSWGRSATVGGTPGALNNPVDTAIDPGIKCQGQVATIVGTNGDDVLVGTSGRDVIVGLGGNDIIRGGDGDDIICGGDGRDRIFGNAGTDRIVGNRGNDRLNGGNGNDVIAGGNGADVVFGDNGNDSIKGNAGNDRISGGNGADVIYGGNGGDTINGNWGWDRIFGGNGHDTIAGGNGADTINGNRGNDTVSGGKGDDIVNGNLGVDSVSGGIGEDTCIAGSPIAQQIDQRTCEVAR